MKRDAPIATANLFDKSEESQNTGFEPYRIDHVDHRWLQRNDDLLISIQIKDPLSAFEYFRPSNSSDSSKNSMNGQKYCCISGRKNRKRLHAHAMFAMFIECSHDGC